MSYEDYKEADSFNTARCLTLFDKIPDWRQGSLDQISNMQGMDVEMVRDCIEVASEDPEKIKRIGELLVMLGNPHKFGEDVEKSDVPEKIKELLTLIRY